MKIPSFDNSRGTRMLLRALEKRTGEKIPKVQSAPLPQADDGELESVAKNYSPSRYTPKLRNKKVKESFYLLQN